MYDDVCDVNVCMYLVEKRVLLNEELIQPHQLGESGTTKVVCMYIGSLNRKIELKAASKIISLVASSMVGQRHQPLHPIE